MAAGDYRSENDLLVSALEALADRRAAIEGIGNGLADMRARRYRSRTQFTRRLLKQHQGLAKRV
jgi:hypothetical protein